MREIESAGPARTTREYYEERAERLLRAFPAGDEDAVSQVTWHLRLSAAESRSLELTVEKARLVIARSYDFPDWEALEAGLRGAAEEGRLDPCFDAAVDAVIAGDLDRLRALLAERPGLARARSWLPHRATLLHYVAANGVELELQKTPPNAPEVARALLAAGADPDATAGMYGGGSGSTPLVGLVSSIHPAAAGVQAELVRVLCAGGARADGIDGDGQPLATALAFWYPPAAEAVIACGASVENLAFAAAAGRLDLVDAYVDDTGALRPEAPRCRVKWFETDSDPRAAAGQGLIYACMCGRTAAAELLLRKGVSIDSATRRGETALHLAAWCNQRDAVIWLLERGADPNLPDARFHSPPWGWAGHNGHRELRDLIRERAAESCLFAAAAAGMAGRVRALAASAPETVNDTRYWTTPLGAAAANGALEAAAALLELGADPAAAGRGDGLTPREEAEAAGHAAVAELLGRHEAGRTA